MNSGENTTHQDIWVSSTSSTYENIKIRDNPVDKNWGLNTRLEGEQNCEDCERYKSNPNFENR